MIIMRKNKGDEERKNIEEVQEDIGNDVDIGSFHSNFIILEKLPNLNIIVFSNWKKNWIYN